MPSFDIVSQVNQQEVKNAVEQTNKEITNRFDFKGSDARVELGENLLTVYADDEFKLGQVTDVLRARLAKRNVDVRCLEPGTLEKISGDKVKRPITVKVGVSQEKGKQIQKLVKDSKQTSQLFVNDPLSTTVLRDGRPGALRLLEAPWVQASCPFRAACSCPRVVPARSPPYCRKAGFRLLTFPVRETLSFAVDGIGGSGRTTCRDVAERNG